MLRLPQKEMDVRPGDGPNVILVDCTGSMRLRAKERIDRITGHFATSIPNVRVFGFAYGVVEIEFGERRPDGTHCAGIMSADPPDGCRNDQERYNGPRRNGTYLGRSMQQIEPLRPRRLIIMSDFGSVDKWRALRTADRMGCPIDCYFFHASERDRADEDPRHGAELARRSRGRFVDLAAGETLHQEMKRSLYPPHHSMPQYEADEEEAAMDYTAKGSKINVQAPPVQRIRVEEHIFIENQRVLHDVRMPDQWIKEGIEPEEINYRVEPSTVQIEDKGEVIEHIAVSNRGVEKVMSAIAEIARVALLGPKARRQPAPQRSISPPKTLDAPQIEAPRERHMGELKALPSPTEVRQQVVLPPPAAAGNALIAIEQKQPIPQSTFMGRLLTGR